MAEKDEKKPDEEPREIEIVRETKEIEPVAQIRRRSAVERASENIRNEIIYDVVVPKGRDYLFDIGQGILGILSDIMGTALYGEDKPVRNVRRGRRGDSYQDYGSYSRSSISWRERNRSNRPPWEGRSTIRGRDRSPDPDDIEFPTRRDAEKVLDDMIDMTMDYGSVSVDYFFQHPLVNVASNNAMDRKMGWEELSDARVRASDNGMYFIEFPRPHRIDLD